MTGDIIINMRMLEIPYAIYTFIINCIAALTSRIPARPRAFMMNAALFCLTIVEIAAYSNKRLKDLIHYSDCALIISTIALLVLTFASIDRKVRFRKCSKYNTLFWVGWYACFILILISSLKYYVRDSYGLWSILCLVLFPVLMIIWNERGDFSELFIPVAHFMVLGVYIFLAANLLIVPFVMNDQYVGIGYLGITTNQNGNGLIVLPFFTAALYLLVSDRNYREIYVFTMALCVMFAYISRTRTAELVIIAELIAAVILFARNKSLFTNTISWKKTAVLLIASLLFCAALGKFLLYIDKMDLNAYAEGEYIEAMEEVTSNKTLTTINNLSSGRLLLWKAYIKCCGFAGHGNPHGELFEGIPATKWAHNNAIDIWYASGFIAFVGYIVWLMAAWWFVIKCLVGRLQFRKEYLLTVLAFIGYFTEAMLEITIYPMNTGIAFLSFITLTPVAFKIVMVSEPDSK